MKKLILSLLAAVFPLAAAHAGSSDRPAVSLGADLHPADRWEFAIESGYAWEAGSNTSINYQIVPTQFVLRSPAMFTWFDHGDGSKLVLRNRFALLTESIAHGPEDYYVGLSAAPSLEYWFSDKTSVFFAIGGGFGQTDSTYTYDGLGQNFILNWFAELGARQQIARNLSVLGGAYFLHHSDGGMSHPNPGIDALGFTLGLAWQF